MREARDDGRQQIVSVGCGAAHRCRAAAQVWLRSENKKITRCTAHALRLNARTDSYQLPPVMLVSYIR
jgi:hypothetical protein